MTTARGSQADSLQARLRGRVVDAADPAYDELRRTFNAMIDRRPRLIARPLDTNDVVAAVRWAGEAGLPISIRGGGHSVAGHAVGPDALMLDLRELRAVTVDAEAGVADVAGGALLEDLDRATAEHGLAAPSGTYSDTGVGGLTLVGGIGYLVGLAGFACDALVGAEIVTADGTVLQVDERSDPDLLWALRGGGGNFGVVTRFRHALTPLEHVYGGRLRIAGEAAPEVLHRMFELQGPDAPDELTLQAVITRDPQRGLSASVIGLWAGDPAEGAARWRPFTELPGAYVREVGPTTYLHQQTLGDRMGPTYRHYWKSQFVGRVDGDLERAILEHGVTGVEESIVLVEPIHGQAHRYPDDHAAFGNRRALANVSALAIWSDPGDDDRAIDWARTTTAAFEPFSRGGAYLNYASDDEAVSRVRSAFEPATFARLQAVKRRVDPTNQFRFNANVPPD